jgi:CHAT domain-containing protein
VQSLARTSRRAALSVAGALLLSAAVSAQAPADSGDLKAANDRAAAARLRGEVLAARGLLLTNVEQATARGDKAMLQRALSLLADVHVDLSDWAAVLDYGQRAYDVQPDPTGRARMTLMLQTGRVYQELRERDRSRAAYFEVEALAKAAGDTRMLASVYNELGLLTWRLDRNKDEAVRYYDQSIALAEQNGDPRAMMIAYNSSGNVFRVYDYAESERRYRLGMAAGKKAGIDEEVLLLKNMGIVYRETGRRDEARRSLERAMELSDQRGAVRTQWQSRMELGTLHAASDPVRAAEYYEQTLRLLEGLNNNVLLEGFRAGALSGSISIQDDPYDLYTDLLLANGRERDAFVIAERARARTFLDTLSLAREQIAGKLPEAFVAEERELLAVISRSQGGLRAVGLEPSKRAVLGAEIERAEQRLSQMRLRLATEHPALAHARYPTMATVDDVQRRLLGPGEVLLQYFVSARASTLWAITPSAVHVRRLPPRSDIESTVRALLDQLGRPGGDYQANAKKLGAMLLPDLSGVIDGAARLIVVPHAILSYVPFEALMIEGDRFLITRHPVSYAPSASSLAFLRERTASGTEVLAIGNPVMQNQGTETLRGQPISRVAYLKPLAFSGLEVRSVSDVYGSAAHVFEQEAATEEALTAAAASRAGIIHIATHGLIDEDVPDRSGLALTAAPPRSDGILQMREVYNLRLNAALVTLSACQSALGKEITGEGLIGLSRAFFYAGSNAVIASLWNVNDASTERLMSPFYRSLAAGEPIDRSLQATKLAMLEAGGRFSHPYYWAAFVVTGNGTAAIGIRPGADNRLKVAGFVGILALISAGAVVLRRRVR